MGNLFTLSIIIILLFLGLAFAYDNHDFQVWNIDVEELKINDKSKVAFEQEFRWGNNASEFFYQHYDLGYFYNLKKWLMVGGGYRHVIELKRGKWKVENEPYLSATLSGKFAGYSIDSRSRLEYNHFDYQEDSFRYRNKVTVKSPWKFTKLGIQPYVSEEVFVKFSGWSGFNQNRVSGGLLMSFTKNLTGEIYYMLQSSKSAGVWKEANVLGTKFKLTF